MAQPEVKVSFGASVEGLLRGVKEAEAAIQSLRKPVDDFIESMKGIGEATGLAFAVEKIREFTVEMAELGEHAVNMGAALGMSAEQFQQVNEAMGLVGASGDALVRTERLLSRAADDAVKNSLSPQNAAFRALGIGAKEFGDLLRDDPVAAMKELAEAATRTGTAVSGPLGRLLGRGGGADLLRFFSEGAAGIDKWITKTRELGAPSQEALEHLDHLAGKIHELTTSFTNLGAAIVDHFNGPISKSIELATELANVLGLLIKGLPEVGPRMAPVEGTATEEEKAILERIKQHESGGRYDILHGPGGKPSGTITDWSKFPEWQGFMGPAGMSHAAGAYGFQPGTYEEMAKMTGYTSFLPEAQDINALQLYRMKGAAPWPWLAKELGKGGGAEGGTEKTTLPDVGVQADAENKAHKVKMENLEAEKKELDDNIKKIDQATKAQLAQLDFEKTAAQDKADVINKIEMQKIATVQEAEAKKQALIAKSTDVVRAAAEGERDSTTQLINLQNQAMRIDQQHRQQQIEDAIKVLEARIRGLNQAEAADLKQIERERKLGDLSIGEAERRRIAIVKVYEEMVAEILDEEQKLATGIPGLSRRITGEQVRSAQEAAQKTTDAHTAAHDEIEQSAKATGESVSRSLSGALTGVITGRQTIGQAGRQLGEEAMSKIMDTVMEKTVGRLVENAISNLLQQIAADAANTGILSGLLAAIFAKPSVAGTTFGAGGIVGGWTIPHFQSGGIVAQVHQGEAVLPTHWTAGLDQMFRSGNVGASPTINIHAIDTQSGSQFLMQHGASIASAWRDGGMAGNLSPRSISSGGRFP